MGIYKFFSYLKTRELVVLYDKSRNKKNHIFFIDGTNIFRFYCQFPQKGKNSFCCVRDLITRFIPAGFAYIAMDGKSPEQKILNQRRKSAQAQDLSVGGQLRAEEESHGQSFADFGVEIGCDTRCDGRDSEGEAEHKIVRRIREQISSGELQKGEKHCVVSNDNDVIFLLLQFADYDFSVVRVVADEETNLPAFYIVDIQKVRDYFMGRVHRNCGRNDFSVERATSDVIALSFFLGNDFVGCFSEIEKCHDAFDGIVGSCCQMNSSRSCPYRHLTDGSSFVDANLKTFFAYLVARLKGCQQQQQQVHRDSLRQCQKKSFYKKKTVDNRNVKPNFNCIQRDEARDMIKALRWTLSYYLYEIPSWKYQYLALKMITLSDFWLLIDVAVSMK
ncbi:5'-3' exoribonuclease 1 [Tritrichomonas musculus]|uniref:5'-3' exoribonuclease 1 n=1 Tax=Tritrichomonas musculus TaxID=1915356 RepID=A0ABR2JPX7_9EUKA